MSSSFPDPVKPRWLSAGPKWAEFLILSELKSWTSHWDSRCGRSRRCGGPGCALCHSGYQKQLRVVVLAVDASGRDTLIELRERHRSQLDGYESTVGLAVKVRRNGTARNSPVQIEVLGTRTAAERDIGRLIEVLGMEPLFVATEKEAYRAVEPIIEQLGESDELFGADLPNPVGYEDFE